MKCCFKIEWFLHIVQLVWFRNAFRKKKCPFNLTEFDTLFQCLRAVWNVSIFSTIFFWILIFWNSYKLTKSENEVSHHWRREDGNCFRKFMLFTEDCNRQFTNNSDLIISRLMTHETFIQNIPFDTVTMLSVLNEIEVQITLFRASFDTHIDID